MRLRKQLKVRQGHSQDHLTSTALNGSDGLKQTGPRAPVDVDVVRRLASGDITASLGFPLSLSLISGVKC